MLPHSRHAGFTRLAYLNWLACALAALTIGASWHLDDNGAEWQQADTLADAQRAARAAQRAELDAIRQCTATHGAGVAIAYTVDGDLICKARRGGGVAVASSKGGAL